MLCYAILYYPILYYDTTLHYIILYYIISQAVLRRAAPARGRRPGGRFLLLHACHIIPPSEIGWGLFWAVFTGSEGK